jgi:hypothetical protein
VASGLGLNTVQLTVGHPQIHPQIGQVSKVTDFCGDGRAATPIACAPDVGQVLKATGDPISGLSTVLRCAGVDGKCGRGGLEYLPFLGQP